MAPFIEGPTYDSFCFSIRIVHVKILNIQKIQLRVQNTRNAYNMTHPTLMDPPIAQADNNGHWLHSESLLWGNFQLHFCFGAGHLELC